MSNSHTVKINEGQTLLLYKGDKIILRKKHDCISTVTTTWDVFVGSDVEVDAKIESLSLSEIKRPTQLKKEIDKSEVAVKTKPTVGERLLNFLKTIFSK